MEYTRPEDVLIFRTLPKETELVVAMSRLYQTLLVDGLPREEALFCAWQETHQEAVQFEGYCAEYAKRANTPFEFDAMTFISMLRTHIDYVVENTQTMIDYIFADHAEALALHDGSIFITDPCEMLEVAGQPLELISQDNPVELRRITDAQQLLARALKHIAQELADPQHRIKSALRIFDEISRDCLFDVRQGRELFLVSEISPPDFNRVVGFREDKAQVWLFKNRQDSIEYATKLARLGKVVRREKLPWKCRVVTLPDRNYVVYVKSRCKGYVSMERKLEGGGRFKDSRGTKFIMVAVEDPDEGLRVARRQDVVDFRKVVLESMIDQRLVDVPDDSPNRDRHPNYWDKEITWEFIEDGLVATIELILIDVGDHLSDKYTNGSENHKDRRRGQLIRDLCPLLWPDHDWTDPEL